MTTNATGGSDLLYKTLIVGESHVGKTCLVRRFVHNMFLGSNKATVGVDFALKVVPHGGRNITLQIWDVAGQERYGQLTRVYFQNAVGAAVVCDVTQPETYEAAIKWKRDLDSKVFLPRTSRNVPCLLLLNKCDLDNSHMSASQLDDFCQKNGFVGWFLLSAKDGTGVQEAFSSLVEHIMEATQDPAAVGAGKAPAKTPGAVSLQRGAKQKEEKKKCPC